MCGARGSKTPTARKGKKRGDKIPPKSTQCESQERLWRAVGHDRGIEILVDKGKRRIAATRGVEKKGKSPRRCAETEEDFAGGFLVEVKVRPSDFKKRIRSRENC